MSQRTLGSTRLISRGAISDGSQFEWETRTIVFVSLSPMIYMIIVGRLNADGALLIRLHSSFRLRSPPQRRCHGFYEDNNSLDYRSSRSHLIVCFP